MDAKDFFQNRLTLNQKLNKKFHSMAVRIASIRVVVFLMGILVFVYFVNDREMLIAITALFVATLVFVLLVKKHNKLKFARDQHKYLSDINSEEMSRLDGDLSAIENGEEFSLKDHPYAEDLDIFGNHSIFQLLNRTSTFPGQELLANRLKGSKSVPDLAEYQQSVAELAQNPQLMQEYQALGRHVHATSADFDNFKTWLNRSSILNKSSNLKFWLFFLPMLLIVGVILATIFSITYYTLLPLIMVNLIMLGRNHKYAQEVVASTSASLKMLRSFAHHIQLLESNKYSTRFLNSLANSFNQGGHHAKHEINRIAGLLEQLQVRENLLHIFINIPFLLDLQWLLRIEQWQQHNREHVEEWFNSLAEFEVLISLAGQAFAHNTWAYPKFDSKLYSLKCMQLGHPLIMAGQSVANDFAMQGKGELILLTGPNMAGKSTFLRTIGVNIIMAQMGGVVCATEFVFNPDIKVFTAMRIKDDLSENISSFYAELSRIKRLLNLVEQGEPVLYFLDEILKGTNSADRHKGAVALMKQLSNLQVSGFISTHDLALGELSKELSSVRNFSFESIISAGKIEFDYTIRPGICKSFNACELMRQMGIEV
jgi:DNA mismatch repair ATPase MutS